MPQPAEEDDPEKPGDAELDEGRERASLEQLPQAGDEKAAKRGDHVTCGALARHMAKFVPGYESQQVKIGNVLQPPAGGRSPTFGFRI